MLHLVLQVQCVACMVRETLDVDTELLIKSMQQWKLESQN
jgi:hypothetical protein